MDCVDSFNSFKPSKEERRIHNELTTLYECPGCRDTTQGLRQFSDHKLHCKPFSSWLEKFKRKCSPRDPAPPKTSVRWVADYDY